MEENIKTVFITKYWETKGIYEEECRITEYNTAYPIKSKWIGVLKSYWHENRDDAVKAVIKLRDRKIKSLETKVEKLKKYNP